MITIKFKTFNKKVEKTIVAKTQEVDDWETF